VRLAELGAASSEQLQTNVEARRASIRRATAKAHDCDEEM